MNVWGIGLNKTGVTSLTEALRILGYNAKKVVVPGELLQFEAGTDMPVAARYKWLDKTYPGSKFILTIRHSEVNALDDWLESCRAQWERAQFPELVFRRPYIGLEISFYRTKFFGGYEYDRATFVKAYWNHIADVMSYFDSRRSDLLVLNICSGKGWPELCSFLGKPVPDVDFPHLNEGINVRVK